MVAFKGGDVSRPLLYYGMNDLMMISDWRTCIWGPGFLTVDQLPKMAGWIEAIFLPNLRRHMKMVLAMLVLMIDIPAPMMGAVMVGCDLTQLIANVTG